MDLDVEGLFVGLADGGSRDVGRDVGLRDVGRDVGLGGRLGLVAVDEQGMDAHLVVSMMFA